MEVYYPNCTNTVTEFYERIAQKHGLIPTGGSDDHGRAKGYTYVGKKTVPYTIVEQLRQATNAWTVSKLSLEKYRVMMEVSL